VEFLDSNVVLYAYDTSAGAKYLTARQLVRRLGRSRSGAVSVQVLQEFYVNAVSKIAARMSPEEARSRLRALSRWSVHSPMAADVMAAIHLATENQISFRDAMIVRSAGQLGCATLWSEDLNAGQTIGGVLIANPFAGG
jgi:predicted nucleic acid-binding protein